MVGWMWNSNYGDRRRRSFGFRKVIVACSLGYHRIAVQFVVVLCQKKNWENYNKKFHVKMKCIYLVGEVLVSIVAVTTSSLRLLLDLRSRS